MGLTSPGRWLHRHWQRQLLFRAYKIVTPYTVSGVVTSNHDHQGMEGVLITFERTAEVIGSLSTNENGFYLLTDLTGKK